MQTSEVTDAALAEQLLETVPGFMKVLRREMRRSSGDGFSLPQLRILAHVRRGAETAAELADLQGVSLAAISKHIESMVRKGLLAREFRDGNRKQIFLKLTEAGVARYHAIREEARGRVAAHVERLPPPSKRALATGLSALGELVHASKS